MAGLTLEHDGSLYVPTEMPQISLPMGLHCGVTVHYELASVRMPSNMTQEIWRSIEPMSSRFMTTQRYAVILTALHQHTDWMQIREFFVHRYIGLGVRNRSGRTMQSLATGPTMRNLRNNAKRKVVLDVNTRPENVGLPTDFLSQLREVHRLCHSMVTPFRQPDQVTRAFGPAISVAVGPYVYMNMLYNRNVPAFGGDGTVEKLNPLWDPGYAEAPSEPRTLEDWLLLFRELAEWVYECDAQLLENGAFPDSSVQSYCELYGNDLAAFRGPRIKKPRDWLKTPAIEVADAMRDLFEELFQRPFQFQGREWDYLELELHPDFYKAFLARFGPRPNPRNGAVEHRDYVKDKLTQDILIDLTEIQTLIASSEDKMRLQECPLGTDGMVWSKWMTELLQVEDGIGVVIPPRTAFQALWTVILLAVHKTRFQIIKAEDLASQDIRKIRKDTVYVV